MSMSKTKKSAINTIVSLAYKVITCAIGIVLPRLFVMTYGSEINGLQSSVSQIFTYIALLEAGVGASAMKSLYKTFAEDDHDGINTVASTVSKYYNKIGLIYIGILISISFIYPFFVKVESLGYFSVLAYIIFAGLTTGLNFFFQSKILLLLRASGDGYIESFMCMLTYVIATTIKILCIFLNYNIVIMQMFITTANLLMTFLYYCIIKRKYPWLSLHEHTDDQIIEQKKYALIHQITGIIFQNVDILLLTFLCDLKVVSIYTMYKLVINMVTTVIASFSSGPSFAFGQVFNSNDKKTYCKLIDTFNVYYSSISFALYTVTYILILPFMRLYTSGMDTNYIFNWLPLLYVLIEVLQVGREAMLQTINVSGRYRETVNSAVIESIINILISVLCILLCKKLWGDVYALYGALMGTIVALLYRTIDINCFANRVILERSAIKSNRVIVINATVFSIIAFLYSFISLKITNYIEFICVGALTTIIVIPIYLIIQSILNKNEFMILRSFIDSKFKK